MIVIEIRARALENGSNCGGKRVLKVTDQAEDGGSPLFSLSGSRCGQINSASESQRRIVLLNEGAMTRRSIVMSRDSGPGTNHLFGVLVFLAYV